MSKSIRFSPSAQEAIGRGIDIIADAVGATMGPSGQNVIVEKSWGAPMVTKDGVSVAKEIDLKDKFEKLGADLVKEAASKTNDVAGDGTTTATVLARAIYREGYKLVAAGHNPVEVKRQIDDATKIVVERLGKMATTVETKEELCNVATISANSNELGTIIANVMHSVGKDGLITIEESPSFTIETEETKGMKLEGGYISPYMINDPDGAKNDIADCPVFVTDRKITMATEILPLMESMAKKGMKDLLIVADNVEGEALAVLVVNKQRGVFNAVAMRCPGVGDHRRREQMRDICALTGATFISEEMGKNLADAKEDCLGKARKVSVTRDSTTIIDGAGKQEDITARIQAIKAELETTKSDYDQQKLKERLGKISGFVGVIKIGGTNEVEIKEKKQRVEDAVNATRAAQEEGIVVGGGIALLRASFGIPDFIAKALRSPLKTIAENAGKNGEVVLNACLLLPENSNEGYNAKTDTYEDLLKVGVIDPVKVTRTALENAASIAGLLLTTKAALTIDVEDKK